MDEYFELFSQSLGQGFDRRDVPQETIDKFRGKLPEYLISHWQEHGWCGYADGLFWTVNPEEYEDVLEEWIGDTEYMERDAYHIIARGAFGELYFWGERSGTSLSISAPYGLVSPGDKFKFDTPKGLEIQAGVFFAFRNRDENNIKDLNNKPLFERALKRLGKLKYNEMYGFVPALGLGGSAKLENLQKLEADVHLSILAQCTEREVLTASTIGAYL
jgi:hypothetical protein